MRVLLATPYLHPEGGGLERYAATVTSTLARDGHDVTLVGHTASPLDEVGADGVRRVGVRPSVKLSNTPLSPAFLRAVRRLVRESRPDVVNGHAPVPGAAEMAWWVARRERVPFALTYHAGALLAGHPALALPARAHRATVERAMIASADARIAVSDYVAREVFAGRPHALAPPGVDVARFTPGGAPEPGRVLYVGPVSRAYAWKGLATLADAMDIVRERVPDARLRAVGDGDLAGRYRARGVEVVGRVDDARLVEEYRAASVVALPSLTPAESFGMALAEANACGRPVVGSRVGGIPCFVRHGENGLLAEPGDAASLAARLAKLLSDEALAARMGATGRALVEREHRWEDVAARCLTAFQEAVARRSGLPSAARPSGAGPRASGRRPARP